MTAEPIRDDSLDPQWILADLPEDERGFFLSQYRDAVEEARDPAGYRDLRRLLRLWRFHADAAKEPGYRAAREAARNETGGGMLLEDYLRMRRGA